ncbi:helix-turn-helix domain-containing protein [Roseomonas terrae]|jgi:transcriptional regulator with XRE-family HTH domain|uniref:Helix-turn-helix domain-containing protein n=1 Tax=Neoroseomonas terrae TaxID=424799 RepID=A0ABS5EDE0_9PROT|nr:helix-turn-helix domain-containing protein [Neoroseomonas terrae]MBR0649033.1 helix-turn-helix domain-containing protein [Neoroseomonas terrae]
MASAAPTPTECRARREALGLSLDQATRRAGLTPQALLRFESGEGGLTDGQLAALARALAASPATARPASGRAMLDLGPVGTVLLVLGGAIPAAMAAVTAVDAARFLRSEVAVADVVGFERRTRIAEPERGERYTYETLAPLLRFRTSDGAEVTIAWRDMLPGDPELAEGARIRLVYPRDAPELAAASYAEVFLKPLVCLALSLPLLAIAAVSWGHWRRRRGGGPDIGAAAS